MAEIDRSTEPERGAFVPLLFYGAIAISGVLLSQFAFSTGIRREIIERDGGCIDADGNCQGRLIASHINHDKRSPNYNCPKNGVCRCHYHEMIYHIDTEGHNGLSHHENMSAIKGQAGILGLLGQVNEIIYNRKYGFI